MMDEATTSKWSSGRKWSSGIPPDIFMDGVTANLALILGDVDLYCVKEHVTPPSYMYEPAESSCGQEAGITWRQAGAQWKGMAQAQWGSCLEMNNVYENCHVHSEMLTWINVIPPELFTLAPRFCITQWN